MKIVIVDDDILVSSALKTILEAGGEVEVTGTGQDGKDAVRLYDELLPDVLLMDIRMKDMNGLDAAEQILKRHTDAKILFLLTTFSDDAYIVKALKYGVKGYLIKQDYGSILPALQAVQMNQTVFGTEIMSRIPGLLQKEQKEKEQTFDWNSYGIGQRELEITALVAEGLSNKEISEKSLLKRRNGPELYQQCARETGIKRSDTACGVLSAEKEENVIRINRSREKINGRKK